MEWRRLDWNKPPTHPGLALFLRTKVEEYKAVGEGVIEG